MTTDQVERHRLGGIHEGHRVSGQHRHVAQPRPRHGGHLGSQPPGSNHLVHRADPADSVEGLVGGFQQVAGRPGAGVKPPEPGLATLSVHQPGHGLRKVDELVPHVDLAVVGGDDDRSTRRKPGGQLRDHGVARRQLLLVAVGQPKLVGRSVDVVPVGVYERLTAVEGLENPGHEAVPVPVPHEAGVGQVDGREPRLGESLPGHHRWPLRFEQLAGLELPGIVPSSGIPVPGGPPQSVQHLGVGRPLRGPDGDPIPDHPVESRRHAGGYRGEGGRRRAGGDRGDRSAGEGRQVRSGRRTGPQLLPAQAVQDQQEDPPGPEHLSR